MNRTLVIRVGTVERAREELKQDLAAIARRQRVRHRREIWFASLAQAAAVLTDRRVALLRLISQRHPRSISQLARAAGRGVKAVSADVRVLADVGLVQFEGERPVASFDRIQLAGDIAVARAAA